MLSGGRLLNSSDSRRGFFGFEDPGPCVALLRDIGIDPVELHEGAQEPEGPTLLDSNLRPGAGFRRQKKGETAAPEETE
eukprot:5504919-Pyramimonas_sp.AAC.1